MAETYVVDWTGRAGALGLAVAPLRRGVDGRCRGLVVAASRAEAKANAPF